jgi:sulfite reductase (NADPH) flavoprotein alpha-component
MSEERPRSPRFYEGLEQGRVAAKLLPENAPLSPEQRAWLGGFLTGLLGANEIIDARASAFLANDDVTSKTKEVEAEAAAAAQRDNPFAVRLKRVETLLLSEPYAYGLTADTDGSKVEFSVGDRAGVCRQNDPDRVRALLRRLNARGQEDVTARRGTGPAWQVLLEETDIETPSRNFVSLLASVAKDREERRSLEALLDEIPEGMNVSNLLRRFPSARPRVAELVPALHAIEPSIHPIAASPLAAECAIDLLVVAGAAHGGARARVGVAPSIVTDIVAGRLRKGDWLPLFVVPRPEFQLPEDPLVPLVFIGSGAAAGTARAFCDHRSRLRPHGRSWVLLAPSFPDADTLYQRDFERFLEARVLARLDCVSGGISSLVDRVLVHGEMLSRWLLDGAVVYVETSPEEAPFVERALATVLERHRGLSAEAARASLVDFRATDRLRFAAL